MRSFVGGGGAFANGRGDLECVEERVELFESHVRPAGACSASRRANSSVSIRLIL